MRLFFGFLLGVCGLHAVLSWAVLLFCYSKSESERLTRRGLACLAGGALFRWKMDRYRKRILLWNGWLMFLIVATIDDHTVQYSLHGAMYDCNNNAHSKYTHTLQYDTVGCTVGLCEILYSTVRCMRKGKVMSQHGFKANALVLISACFFYRNEHAKIIHWDGTVFTVKYNDEDETCTYRTVLRRNRQQLARATRLLL